MKIDKLSYYVYDTDYILVTCYDKTITDVTIDSRCTSINQFAFYECSRLTSIAIPEGVTSIGSGAFQSCSSLTSITIPSSVTLLHYNTFVGCNLLTEIRILATNPPSIAGGTLLLNSVKTIYIPSGTLSTYQSAQYWSSLASKFVEMEA